MQTTAAMLKRADERIKSLLLSREYCVKQMQARRRKRDEQPWHVEWVNTCDAMQRGTRRLRGVPVSRSFARWVWQAACCPSHGP